ncbi:MAG TPA: P1 family peptidase [Pyrinomonadaceae bacterium]|nr:P1 family peptidase [Pyrinomonadaceae bacterium]
MAQFSNSKVIGTMGQMGTDALVTGLAIIGIVIIVSALLSGLVDKSGLLIARIRLQSGARPPHSKEAPYTMKRLILWATLISVSLMVPFAQSQNRPRAREAGIIVGVLPPGPLNAITDVDGVLVGHTTLVRGDNVRTGVTAILPHGGNLFREKVPGAVFVGNGFGKLAGSTQVNELGEIETPILLTSTLSVPRTADFLIDYMLALPGNEDVQSINPLVAETNDGYLNDIRGRHLSREDVFAAIKGAKGGAVAEGSVGAGTGTVAFGFKGGIGTSSRKLPQRLGGFTVGVLVQTNFGGVLTINGAPVGRELGRYYLKDELTRPNNEGERRENVPDGSIIIVIATDAPLDARNLNRMAARAMMGLARTGAAASNGSGDYAIAFSTSSDVRIRVLDPAERNTPRVVKTLANDAVSPLFLAVIEATEEAIYNSLFRANTISGRGRTVEALPLDRTLEILRKHGLTGPSQ